jgi:nucleoside-specific outer membrane channel protein Tsx
MRSDSVLSDLDFFACHCLLQLVTFWILAFAKKISMLWVNIITRYCEWEFSWLRQSQSESCNDQTHASNRTATPHHIEKSQTFGVNHGYPSYSHPDEPSSRYELCCADGFRFHRWFVGCTLAANRMGATSY